jgi:hypothetical protein
MVLRRAVGIAIASIVLVGATRELQAQPITATDAAGASFSAMINGIKQPLATTIDAAGQVTIDTSALNIPKGTEVTVWIKTCEDGTVQVILVPAGEEGECAEEGQQAGEDCGCRRAGVIIWGNGPVTIDVGRGTATQTRTQTGTTNGLAQNRLIFGAGLDILQMTNLENVLEQVPGGSDASATGWAPGLQLLAEWQLRRILAIGIDAGFSRMETELRFPQGVQTGDLDYYEVGVSAKLGIPTTGRVWPYATVALHRTWNKADFEIDGLSEHRVHKTRRDGIGAGLDYYPRSNWGFRFEGLYSSTFEDDDADEHIRWKLALLFGLPFGTDYAQDRGGLYE